jgi:anti-sigma factor RsiW
MTTGRPFTDEDLHAAADGRLDAERLAELEGHLASHAAEAARLIFYMTYDEDDTAPPSFADMAVKAHAVYTAEVRHAVQVPASDEAHLTQWLSKRLDEPVRVPKLSRVGYEFIGGSLLPADQGVAAQLMYQNEAGNRVTLYFKRDRDSSTAFRYLAEGDLSTFYWRDGDFVYALTGELPRAQLLPVCNEVYEQLNPGAPAPSGW